MSRIDDTRDFIPVRIAVLTVSDTRTTEDDRSGQVLVDRIAADGHVLAAREILPDERDLIADKLRQWIADPDIDVVISTGGTGGTIVRVQMSDPAQALLPALHGEQVREEAQDHVGLVAVAGGPEEEGLVVEAQRKPGLHRIERHQHEEQIHDELAA